MKIETRIQQVVVIFILLRLGMAHLPKADDILECYSCSGGEKCGKLFSPNSSIAKTVKSKKNETLHSCSITVTPEGLTTRSMMPSYECRSSSYQFCCNENFCNSLPSPPLPAFTSLKCAVGKCSLSNGICIYDAEFVTTLSSPTESCSVTFGHENYKYYKKACQPTIKDSHMGRMSAKSNTPDIFCCNSPTCNTGHVGSPTKDVAIQCYTCDSRITGPAGCTIFNESSPNVYKAGSSSSKEACATIVGLAGQDATTRKPYPAFTIRTFIPNCVNQPLGHISYGGAYFKGRIECCSSHFCNTKTVDARKTTRKRRLLIRVLIIALLIVLAILITAAISFALFRFCRKRDNDKFGPGCTKETETSLNLLSNEMKKIHSQQPAVDNYPEKCVTP